MQKVQHLENAKSFVYIPLGFHPDCIRDINSLLCIYGLPYAVWRIGASWTDIYIVSCLPDKDRIECVMY